MSSLAVTQDAPAHPAPSRPTRAGSAAETAIDARLVRACLAGDETAFEEIVRRHQRRVFNLVNGCVRNRADAEEVVDDVFVRAYRGLPAFRGECSLTTWLHRIAVNLARNRYWLLFRRRHLTGSLDALVSADSEMRLMDLIPADGPDASHVLAEREFAALVSTCLGRLPGKQRHILELRGVLDRSYGDIANALGLRIGTVKSRIARARQRLREEVNLAQMDFSGPNGLALPGKSRPCRSNSETTMRRSA